MTDMPTNPQAAAELLPVAQAADIGEYYLGCEPLEQSLSNALRILVDHARLQAQPSPEHGRGDVERVAAIIEGALERHGVNLADAEGTLVDAEAILAALQPAPRQEGEEQLERDNSSDLSHIRGDLRLAAMPTAPVQSDERLREDEVARIVAMVEGFKAKCDEGFKVSRDHGVGVAAAAYDKVLRAILRADHMAQVGSAGK